MAREVGLDAVVRPEVDGRAADRQASRLSQAFDRAADITPTVDTGRLQSALTRAIPGAGLVTGMLAGGGGGGAGGGGGGRSAGIEDLLSPLESIDENVNELRRLQRREALTGGDGGGGAGLLGRITGGAAAGGSGGLAARLGLGGLGGLAGRAAGVARAGTPAGLAAFGAFETLRQAREGVEFGENDEGDTTVSPTGRGLTRNMDLGPQIGGMDPEDVEFEVRGWEDFKQGFDQTFSSENIPNLSDALNVSNLPTLDDALDVPNTPSLSDALDVRDVPSLDRALGGVSDWVNRQTEELAGVTDIDISGDLQDLGDRIVDQLGDPINEFNIDAPIDVSVEALDELERNLSSEIDDVRGEIDRVVDRIENGVFGR